MKSIIVLLISIALFNSQVSSQLIKVNLNLFGSSSSSSSSASSSSSSSTTEGLSTSVTDSDGYTYKVDTSACKLTKSKGSVTEFIVTYDSSSISCRSKAIAMGPSGDLFAVFETQGDSTSSTYISKNTNTDAPSAFSSAIFQAYGREQSNKQWVSVVTKINTQDGTLEYGTFLMSKYIKSPTFVSNIYSIYSYPLTVTSISIEDSLVTIKAKSEGYAPAATTEQDQFYFFQTLSERSGSYVKLTLPYELSEIITSEFVSTRLLTEVNSQAILSVLGLLLFMLI